MKIALIKGLDNKFSIAYDSDYELAKKIKPNEVYEYEFKKTRNIKFHRKFFALVNLCFSNQETFNNIEHLRKELIICAGHYELIFDLESGIQKKEALSISFASMDETAFNTLYNDVLNVICDKFLFDKEDVLNNVAQYF